MSDEMNDTKNYTATVCEICEGLGFFISDKLIVDARYGKSIEYYIYSICECKKINKKVAQATQSTSKKKRDWID